MTTWDEERSSGEVGEREAEADHLVVELGEGFCEAVDVRFDASNFGEEVVTDHSAEQIRQL